MLSGVRRIVPAILVIAGIIGAVPANAQGGDQPYNPVIDPADFVKGVNNPYFPLTPGTTYIYEGESDGTAEHTEVSVTHETREILGIECVVVRDTVWEDGNLIEDTVDWYAQDKDGNVWYMGEDTKEYEDGKVVSTAGSWEAGIDEAKPGIVMWGNPRIGEDYRQEYYAGEAEDMAEVVSLIVSPSGTGGNPTGLLVTKEWTPLEPRFAERKYYVTGIGLVLEIVIEGGEGQTDLVSIVTNPD
ncbi:MAG TPA: hypothetical protein VMT24_07730 [Aggregatilineaceae bacterium]|nr:hypothetical protein [Aggregatilineaceae bacterium]